MQTDLLRNKFGVGKTGYICESSEIEGDDDGFYDDEDEAVSEGYLAMAKAFSNPDAVPLYPGNDSVYYATAESIQNYMLYSGTTEIAEAISNIAEANNIDTSSIIYLGEFDEDYLPEEDIQMESEYIADYEIIQEAVEKGAMSLDKAQRVYNKIIKQCKDDASTKKEIDKCISTLKKCVERMEKEKEDVKNGFKSKDRIKYSLSAIIPFNSLYRLFKYNDWNDSKLKSDVTTIATKAFTIIKDGSKLVPKAATGAAKIAGTAANIGSDLTSPKGVIKAAAKAGVDAVLRYRDYTKMLDRMIKQTNEAIDFLEKKRNKLEDK